MPSDNSHGFWMDFDGFWMDFERFLEGFYMILGFQYLLDRLGSIGMYWIYWDLIIGILEDLKGDLLGSPKVANFESHRQKSEVDQWLSAAW